MEGRIESFELLDSRRFAVLVRGLANSLSFGLDSSPFVGSGVEYVQSRPYQEGDSVRAIDWRVTARTGRFHVKEYEAPKSMPTFFLLDTSASMTVASGPRSKYATALYVAGGLALACLDRVSPVGVLGVGERALRVRPSLSQARVLQWLHELRTFRYDEGTTLALRLSELAPSLGQRSQVIVLSDLHDEGALPALQRLALLHDVVVLQFADPAEESLAGAGFLRASEAETGHEFWTRGARAGLDVERAERELRRAGIDRLLIRTDRPFEHSLRRLFHARGVMGRGTR
ncbi:MAG TPA: DUF58 domain-containing protein [Planctomycetota bacterium]|nr:DUF58 domain-containing protein [Planctomycetota bacterium]